MNSNKAVIFPFSIRSDNTYLLVYDHDVDSIISIRTHHTYAIFYLLICFKPWHKLHFKNILFFIVISLAVRK